MTPPMNKSQIIEAMAEAIKHGALDIGGFGMLYGTSVQIATKCFAVIESQLASRWRPIESAPKDGTEIIISDGVKVGTGYFVDSDDKYAGWYLSDDSAGDIVPTHFMPLPSPPDAGGV